MRYSTIIILVMLILAGCKSEDPPRKGGNTGGSDTDTEKGHPTLFITHGELAQLLPRINSDKYLNGIHDNLITACNLILDKPVQGRVTDTPSDKRILKSAREIMRRIFFLSYAYHTTAQTSYLDRALMEMRSVAGFKDWNAANHFLDVAELTMAMSVGYDWLFNNMTQQDRDLFRTAIIEKGLIPSDNPQYNSNFLNKDNNWSQVCHASMAAGAIVTMDYDKSVTKYIDRAVEKIVNPMALYAPDGAYPEGPDYWEYGTMFNAMLIEELTVALGTDRGLSATLGFMNTGTYSQQMIGSTLNLYCYSDNNSSNVISTPVMWFYKKTKDPQLLYMQKRLLDKGIKENNKVYVNNNRYLPMLLIWAAQANANFEHATTPATNFYIANGTTPICTMRSGWEQEDIFIGVKGGEGSTSHSHMDQGSFILEASGERWAIDLGAENYAKIEAQIKDFWTMTQNSGRWNIFRYNNISHNTLTFSSTSPTFTPMRQNVNGKATFTSQSSNAEQKYVKIDLTHVYNGLSGLKLESVNRGIAMVNNRYAMVQDRIETATKPTVMQWRMVLAATQSDVQLNTPEANMITVTKSNGKKLIIKVESPQSITLKTWSTDPTQHYESTNPNTIIVGYEVQLEQNKTYDFKTYLMPDTQVNPPLHGTIL